MKNKKGFTLIELLAVIVILAIIALIAVPIVLNMISQARRSAARSAALGYVDAIEYNNGFANAEMDGYTLITGTKNVSEINVKMKGKKPDSGSVTVDSNGKVTGASDLCFNGYKVSYDGKDVTTITKGCGSSNNNTPATTVYYYQDKSDKKTQPDPTWNYYIKETGNQLTISSDSYEIVVEDDGEILHSADYGISFASLEECQTSAPTIGWSADSCTLLYEAGTTYPESEACINSSTYGGELCIKPNDFSNTSQSIKNYFGYDSNSWTNTNSSTWKNSDQTITCIINNTGTACYDSTVLISNSSVGSVRTGPACVECVSGCKISGPSAQCNP